MYPFIHTTSARDTGVGPLALAAFALVVCFALIASTPAIAVPTSVSCTSALALEAGEPWSWTASDQASSELVAVEVPAAGWLALELGASGAAPGATWLQVVDPKCSGGVAAPDGFVDRGFVEVREPGTVYLRLGSVHDHPPGSPTLRLASHLFERRSSGGEKDFEKDGAPGDNTEEEDGEIVPLLFPGEECDARFASQGVTGAYDKDGAPGDNTEEEDGEIVPILGGGGDCSVACAGREPANDLLYCAGTLAPGVALAENLGAPDGLDRDYFTFTVRAPGEVRVDAESDLRLHATILDVAGRVLADDELLEREPLTATLPPGRYFLRVEGVGEGEYRLELGGDASVF